MKRVELRQSMSNEEVAGTGEDRVGKADERKVLLKVKI